MDARALKGPKQRFSARAVLEKLLAGIAAVQLSLSGQWSTPRAASSAGGPRRVEANKRGLRRPVPLSHGAWFTQIMERLKRGRGMYVHSVVHT
jgi:hypothetical protein